MGAPNPEDDGDVKDPVDAAGRGTRPPRPPRESLVASDGLGVQPEEQLVREALERITGIRSEQDGRVNHPQQQGPLNEDHSPYLASMCFPCLFPKGKGNPFVGTRAKECYLRRPPTAFD